MPPSLCTAYNRRCRNIGNNSRTRATASSETFTARTAGSKARSASTTTIGINEDAASHRHRRPGTPLPRTRCSQWRAPRSAPAGHQAEARSLGLKHHPAGGRTRIDERGLPDVGSFLTSTSGLKSDAWLRRPPTIASTVAFSTAVISGGAALKPLVIRARTTMPSTSQDSPRRKRVAVQLGKQIGADDRSDHGTAT